MSHRYTVCVYAICKNESAFVDRWIDSMQEADLIIVTDTGSTDDTVERLRSRGATVHQETISPWRFDVARNVSLAHVPETVDLCVCTDLDECFAPGWRDALERAWQADQVGSSPQENRHTVARQGRYLYNWSLKPDGSPDVQFNYFKVHDRADFTWLCPVHEYLSYVGDKPLKQIYIPGMVLSHYPDPTKSRGSYLGLLELAVAEDPQNDRMRYYLGREYLYQSNWTACINTMQEYLALPSATWCEERCAAMRWMAKSYHQLGKRDQATCWYYRAIAEAPHLRDPLIEFALFCDSDGDFPLCYALAKAALAITEKSATYVNMGYSWDHTPDDLAALSLYRMGLVAQALPHAQAALSFSPGDLRLQKNLATIKSQVLKQG